MPLGRVSRFLCAVASGHLVRHFVFVPLRFASTVNIDVLYLGTTISRFETEAVREGSRFSNSAHCVSLFSRGTVKLQLNTRHIPLTCSHHRRNLRLETYALTCFGFCRKAQNLEIAAFLDTPYDRRPGALGQREA